MSLEGGREGRRGEGGEGRGGEGRGGGGGGEGRGGEGRGGGGGGESPQSFGDIFFKHFCCAILYDVT